MLVQKTKAGNDDVMLEQCKNLLDPIRQVLLDRPENGSNMPEIFGMTMEDIMHMKLQRAKDALTTAYSIARTCSICMTTSNRSEETLLQLHGELEKDVKEWCWNNSNDNAHRKRSMFRLPCNACKDCFSNYLSFKSALGKPALKCPGMNCECHLKKAEVKILAPVAYADYEAAMMRYSLKKINNFRICPNADCSAGLVVDVDCKAEKITCTACDFSFCPHCNDLPHPGMSCEDMRRQRHKERWGNAKDFMANETKQCPHCLTWIEKNGGCNHMTCHHCRGEFCWLCFGDWKTHQDCEHKEVVVRRPFNELFPDWLSKPTKTLRPRFAVGNYVSWTADGKSLVGRVLANDPNGLYELELVNSSGRRKIDESVLRGNHNHVREDADNSDDEAFASFLSGFEDIDESGDEKEYVSVELTLKVAPPCCSSCVKTEGLSPNECDRFIASNPEEVQRLLKKYAVNTNDRNSIVLQKRKQHLSFNQLRKFRAEQEKIREAQSLGDSDDESSCICALFSDDEEDSSDTVPRGFFPCSDNESSCSSDDESSCSTPVATILELSDSESDGFSSDDSESDSE